jgi:RHS repeat-associated protein
LPDGEVVTNTYDAGGMLSGLTGAAAYLTDINYYASAKISNMVYGNGVRTDYDYYDTAGETDASAGVSYSYRLKQIRVYKSGDLLNLNYEYDKSDNVKVKRDALNANYTETYGYDDLSRLINASSASYGNKTFQYDTINNIRQKDGHTYQYDTVNPYKLVNDGRYSYTYDANGSIIGRSDGRMIGWDYENRVTTVVTGSNTEGYVYDQQFRRLKKVNGNISTYYFFNDYEEEYTSGVKTNTIKYYFANNRRIAEKSTVDGVRYYHQDHLSSSTAVTNASGVLVLRNNYAPYGEDALSQGSASVRYKFTDKEKDQSGLYFLGARYYDPEMGRFISVDPIWAGDNWYSYCCGNPVKYIDPMGLEPYDDDYDDWDNDYCDSDDWVYEDGIPVFEEVVVVITASRIHSWFDDWFGSDSSSDSDSSSLPGTIATVFAGETQYAFNYYANKTYHVTGYIKDEYIRFLPKTEILSKVKLNKCLGSVAVIVAAIDKGFTGYNIATDKSLTFTEKCLKFGIEAACTGVEYGAGLGVGMLTSWSGPGAFALGIAATAAASFTLDYGKSQLYEKLGL